MSPAGNKTRIFAGCASAGGGRPQGCGPERLRHSTQRPARQGREDFWCAYGAQQLRASRAAAPVRGVWTPSPNRAASCPAGHPSRKALHSSTPGSAMHMQSQLAPCMPQVQSSLLSEAEAFRDANIQDVASYDELKQAIAKGLWARGPWAGERCSAVRAAPSQGCT